MKPFEPLLKKLVLPVIQRLFVLQPLRGDADLNDKSDFHGFELFGFS